MGWPDTEYLNELLEIASANRKQKNENKRTLLAPNIPPRKLNSYHEKI